MTFRDIVANAGGNLWRMKLRSTLTIAGILIAIATFVSMLSFGVGMQENITEEFTKLGLFSTMQVYPPAKDRVVDTTRPAPVLDRAAVQRFSSLPGVNLAYAYDNFGIAATIGDSVVATTAQAMPHSAVRTKLYSEMRAGAPFAGDSDRAAMVTDDFLELVGIENPDSIVGRQLVISAKAISLDSGLAHVKLETGAYIFSRFVHVRPESLLAREFWVGLEKAAAGEALASFMDGMLNARRVVVDTLTISGVLDMRGRGPSRTAPILIPTAVAAHLNSGDLSDDPASLMAALRTGNVLNPKDDSHGRVYPRVTLDLNPKAAYEPIRDSIKAMGYSTFSYAEQFEEIRKFYLYFNLGLTLVGVIALLTASLGIVNTMVMSILERTREIGVLKSLGADDRDIRYLFLVESGLIGVIGAAGGIVFGWIITQIARKVAHVLMARAEIPLFEPFAMPFYLIFGALAFGLAVSLAAGMYPARRAARVDPVEALRHD